MSKKIVLTFLAIKKWFQEAEMKDIEVCCGPNDINVRGVKPS